MSISEATMEATGPEGPTPDQAAKNAKAAAALAALNRHESHLRSFVKAFSWRATGTLDTFLLSWLITGSPHSAGTIAATEVLTKVGLYYLHERAWSMVKWGRKSSEGASLIAKHDSHSRSLAKAISWRTTGTIDTFILSWLITGNLHFAGAIAGSEIITKITLFYFHERVWSMIPWGRKS